MLTSTWWAGRSSDTQRMHFLSLCAFFGPDCRRAPRPLVDVAAVGVAVHRKLDLPKDHALTHQPLEWLDGANGANVVQDLGAARSLSGR
jgi:hypothetical protein